jgi:hypothetical protein
VRRKREVSTQLSEAKRAYQEKLKKFKKDAGVKINKYNAKILDDGKGSRSGSMLELSVLALYKLMQNRGEISALRHQHQVYFTEANVGWRLDFSFIRGGVQWYGEAKGVESHGFSIQRKLWRVYGLGPLQIWHGNARKPFISETIYPNRGAA